MAGQLFAVNSFGGFYASFNLSKELRRGVQATNKFRQFADIKDAWGKVTRTGQTFTWDTVPMMVRASRLLTETNTIPQGSHTIIQGTLTMNERGFSVPFTEALETMAMVSVRQPIMRVLKYDAMVARCCRNGVHGRRPRADSTDCGDRRNRGMIAVDAARQRKDQNGRNPKDAGVTIHPVDSSDRHNFPCRSPSVPSSPDLESSSQSFA